MPTDDQGNSLNLDFETGNLDGWTATGMAFTGQPVKQDTIGQRWSSQVSNKQGDFFVGGYEISLSDTAQGTLTSDWFKVAHPYASFLIGGGPTTATRVDIVARNGDAEAVIATASGNQKEQMRRVIVDLRQHQGNQIAVRLVDEHSGGWGHLNFDDFRFHKVKPEFPDALSTSPLFHPLLNHLRPNPNRQSVTGDTLSKMSVPPGFSVDLVAAEPDVHQPMAFTFDARGRLWVVEGHSYPTKRPKGKGAG